MFQSQPDPDDWRQCCRGCLNAALIQVNAGFGLTVPTVLPDVETGVGTHRHAGLVNKLDDGKAVDAGLYHIGGKNGRILPE